jgi:dolichyl-phosphate beta-glucosyltransferase
MPAPFLSVIIPSFNEQSNIQRGALNEVIDYLGQQQYTYEVILSDDGSTDGTTEQLNQFAERHAGVRVLANKHAGKGPTVRAGMLAASGQWRLFTDFDQSTPLAELEVFLPYTKDYEIVVGSREAESAKRVDEPLLRHLMGRVFNAIVRMLAVPGLRDTQCGFKLFSARATEKLFNQLYIYGGEAQISDAFTGAFDVELLYLARKNHFAIKEVGVHWSHFASDRVSPIKDSIRMLRDIIRIRFADLAGKYH